MRERRLAEAAAAAATKAIEVDGEGRAGEAAVSYLVAVHLLLAGLAALQTTAPPAYYTSVDLYLKRVDVISMTIDLTQQQQQATAAANQIIASITNSTKDTRSTTSTHRDNNDMDDMKSTISTHRDNNDRDQDTLLRARMSRLRTTAAPS